MRPKLAALTPAEDYRWEQLFSSAINSGYSEKRADADAWRGVCEEFPRLRRYDGARP